MSTTERFPSVSQTETNMNTIYMSDRPESYARPQDSVASFETAQGSVYTYDQLGRTSRFKSATGEQMDAQDITVFVDLSLEQEQDILQAYRTKNPIQKTKVYVVERQPDDSPRVIRRVDEVKDPDNLFLAIFRDGKIAENTPATLFPQTGFNVFDTRHFLESDVWKTERHLGNKVTGITYL